MIVETITFRFQDEAQQKRFHARLDGEVAGEQMSEARIVECEHCGGSGELLYDDTRMWDDSPSERAEPCPVCGGTAVEVVEVEPIEMEDLLVSEEQDAFWGGVIAALNEL